MPNPQHWQYQAKAEVQRQPVPLMDSWFIQEPDQVFKAPHQTRPGLFATGAVLPAYDTKPAVQLQTTIVTGGRVFQGQAKAEPITIPAPPAPDMDSWFQQEPDVVRPKHQTRSAKYDAAPSDSHEDLIPAFDWFHQEPNQIFRISHRTRPGWFILVEFAPAVAFDIDWLVQHPTLHDHARYHQQQLVREGMFTTGAVEDVWEIHAPIQSETTLVVGARRFQIQARAEPVTAPALPVPDMDSWFQQDPDHVFRALHLIRPGFFSIPPAEHELVIPSLDWFVQEPEQIFRVLHQTRPGYLGESREPIVVSVPETDWLVQHPTLHEHYQYWKQQRVSEGMFATGVVLEAEDIYAPVESETTLSIAETLTQIQSKAEPTVEHEIAVPAFDWLLQETDVVRPPHQTRPGWFASGREEELIEVDLDWFLQEPEQVFRPPYQTLPGLLVLVESDVLPILDWLHQEPDQVFRAPHQTRTGLSVLIEYDVLPTIDWFQQEPDQVFRAPHQTRLGLSALVEYDVLPKIDWFQQEPDQVFRVPHQTRPGWFTSGREPDVIYLDLDWLIQEPEQIFRAPHQTRPGYFGAPPAEHEDVVSSFDWFSQESDVIRPRHQVRPGWFALVEYHIPIPLDIDWLIQETDVVRPLHQVRPGYSVLGEPPIIPEYDWFVQESDVVRPLHQTRPGLFSLVEFDVLPKIDWLIQEPEQIFRVPHQTRPGFSVLGLPVIAVLDIDWLHQEPDQVFRSPYQVRPGLFSLVEFNVLPKIDWLHQEPEQVFRAPHQTRPGLFALGEPPIIPAFDWWVQETDVVRSPHQIQPGLSALVEFGVPIAVDFDWFQQEPDVVHPKHQVRPGLSVLGEPPIIPEFDWFQQQPDPVKPPEQVQLGWMALAEYVAPPVVDLDWFAQEPDVVRGPRLVLPTEAVIGQPPIGQIKVSATSAVVFGGRKVLYQAKVEPLEPIPVDVDRYTWRPIFPDTIDRVPPREPGLFALGEPPIIPEYDWHVQHPVPLRPLRRPEGAFTWPIYIEADHFGWYIQYPEPLRRPVRPEGFYARSEYFIVPVPDFGWFVQAIDIFRAPPRPEGLFVLGAVPVLPSYGWFVAPPDVIRPPLKLVPEGLYVFGAEPIVPPVPDWMHPTQPDVIRPLHQVRPGYFVIPPRIIPPFTPPLEYFIQICLWLWELEQNGLLPDASSFIRVLLSIVPSGYVKEDDSCFIEEAAPEPSGYEAEDDTQGGLSGTMKDEPPSPSGYTR